MATYTFTAYTEQDMLVSGDTNLNTGDQIVIPTSSSVSITVEDDDSFLSGDNYSNENANDQSGQTATITAPDGSEIGNGGQIYAEQYYWVRDQSGNWYVMVEIEQEGASQEYYTFYTGSGYTAPAEGATLTVDSYCNVTCDWVDYKCLDGGDSPASIAGTFFQDFNNNDVDDAGDGDISGATVELYAWNGSSSYFAGTTTTDSDGNYSFEGLAEGWYYVRFVNPNSNASFVGQDAGTNDAIDSDVNSGGYTNWIWLNQGEQKTDVDAGIEAINTLSDGNEASEVCETDNTVQLINVLDNTIDPEAGDPIVYAVSDGSDGPMTGNVGIEVAGSNGGVFVINEDGSATFNDNGAFDYLMNGQSATTSITYCVKDADGKIVESTYTVTINGKNDTITVDALNDTVTVKEDEGAGDLETLDDGSSSILDNDTENGVDYTGDVIQVNGQTANVGEWVQLDKGRVMINANGTLDFDTDGNQDGTSDFAALNTDETEMVTVNYTIGSQVQSQIPQNVLLVIDVSNSTVGLDGQNIFDGTGVGDVNNDGRADTVLDAQIVAAKALVDDLRNQGIDPALVNVGIVTFSGVDTTGASSYNDATVDSEVVGSFNLGDAGIESALDSILSGSWTNYEAGLSEAEDWFGANASAGDANTMYFLSDGRPITSYDSSIGEYVEQDPSQFLDEVARIEAGFGADIHAIGVGANSSLGILDQIDNTGGAVQVTDAAALTAALLESGGTIVTKDTATVTIKVLGENDAVVIDALDDRVVVLETETSGDTETLDDGSASILDNDTQNGADYAGDVVTVNGQTANVGAFVQLTDGAGNSKGKVKVNADGTVDFDADGDGDGVSDFEALGNNDSDVVTIDYSIAGSGGTTTSSRTIDFEGRNAGDVISDQVPGVTISALRDGQTSGNAAMIFDSENPTGGDFDLATGNLGNVLIISEDDNASIPDDNAGGGTFVFDFDAPSTIENITFLDTEEPTPQIRFYDAAGTLISSQNGPVTVDGGQETMAFNVAGVSRMEIELQGSGAIDNVMFSESVEAPDVTDTATLTIQVDGINNLDDGDEDGVTDEVTAISITNLLDNTEDPEAGEPFVTSAGGQTTENGPVTVLGSNGGTFMIAADGTATFDPGSDFLELDSDQSLTTTATYMVQDAAGDMVTSQITVVVNGIDDPVSNFELGGTVRTQAAGSQSLTFIVDYSIATWTTIAGVSQLSSDGSALDLNGDGLLSQIDTILDNIVASVQGLPANQMVNFIIADAGATDGVVGNFEVTAGALQGAAGSANPAQALSAILAPNGDPSDASTMGFGLAAPSSSTEGLGLDITQALTAAKEYVAANDSDVDEIVVVSNTSTFSADPTEWILVGDPRYDPAKDVDGDGFIITPATSADGVVGELAALGATVDVVVIDPSNSTVLEPLSTVDADIIDLANPNDLNGFGLENLISGPSVIDAGDVVGVKVNDKEYALSDADPATDGFQIELANLPDDPKATSAFVLLDTTEDGVGDTLIDITNDLMQVAGTDRFEFTLDLV